MKNTIKLGVIAAFTIASSTCFCQDLVVQHNSQEQVLYRGFENTMAVSLGEIPFNELNFECTDCEVFPSKPGSIIIKTGNAKTAELVVTCKYNPEIKARQAFRVQNLPAPMIFIGDKESGSEISFDELRSPLSVHYDNCLLLKSNFQIVDWEICVDGSCANDTTQIFTEKAMALVKNGKSNTINLVVKVLGGDGVTRKVAVSYVLKR